MLGVRACALRLQYGDRSAARAVLIGDHSSGLATVRLDEPSQRPNSQAVPVPEQSIRMGLVTTILFVPLFKCTKSGPHRQSKVLPFIIGIVGGRC